MAFNRKKMILEQAVNMFFNYGIQHITMDDIAKNAVFLKKQFINILKIRMICCVKL